MSKGDHALQKSRTAGLEGRHSVEEKRETTGTDPLQPYSRAFKELLMVEDITILHRDTQTVLHSSFIPICLTVSIRRKKMLSTSTRSIRKAPLRSARHTLFLCIRRMLIHLRSSGESEFSILLSVIEFRQFVLHVLGLGLILRESFTDITEYMETANKGHNNILQVAIGRGTVKQCGGHSS